MNDEELNEAIKAIFAKHRIPYEGVYEPRAQKDLVQLILAREEAVKSNFLRAIEDTTAMKQDGIIWIWYEELKNRIELQSHQPKEEV